MLVEILSFEGCPNGGPARAAVERLLAELELEAEAEVRTVHVPDPEAAEHLRFLGSPTVRVNGRDVEPGSSERTDYALACRVFRTEHGVSGQPEEAWIKDALARAAAS